MPVLWLLSLILLLSLACLSRKIYGVERLCEGSAHIPKIVDLELGR